jgi:hypothetical protein
MSKQSRIRWNDEEKQLIITESAFLMKHNKYNLLQAVQKAQKVLKPERRRKIAQIKTVEKWLNEKSITKAQANLKDNDNNYQEEQKKQHEQKLREQIRAEVQREFESKLTIEFLIGQLTNQIVDKIIDGVSQKLPTQPTILKPKVSPTIVHTNEHEKKRHPKVVVVGLLPRQIHEINKDNYKLRLKFTDGRELGGLERSMRSAKHIVLMKDFIKHAHQEIAKKTNVPFTLTSGAITGIRQTLQHLSETLNEEVAG